MESGTPLIRAPPLSWPSCARSLQVRRHFLRRQVALEGDVRILRVMAGPRKPAQPAARVALVQADQHALAVLLRIGAQGRLAPDQASSLTSSPPA